LNPRLWTRKKVIIAGCVVLLILSYLDGILTLWDLSINVIEEGNPIMQWLIEKSPVGFMAVKLMMPVILGFLFWRNMNKLNKFFAYSLEFVLIVYAMIILLHLYWIITA